MNLHVSILLFGKSTGNDLEFFVLYAAVRCANVTAGYETG